MCEFMKNEFRKLRIRIMQHRAQHRIGKPPERGVSCDRADCRLIPSGFQPFGKSEGVRLVKVALIGHTPRDGMTKKLGFS